MKIVEITDQDSTCVDAGWGVNRVGEFAAVPDWVEGATAMHVSRKRMDNFVRVGETNLRAFVDEDPKVALQEAADEMQHDGTNETSKEWWIVVD